MFHVCSVVINGTGPKKLKKCINTKLHWSMVSCLCAPNNRRGAFFSFLGPVPSITILQTWNIYENDAMVYTYLLPHVWYLYDKPIKKARCVKSGTFILRHAVYIYRERERNYIYKYIISPGYFLFTLKPPNFQNPSYSQTPLKIFGHPGFL